MESNDEKIQAVPDGHSYFANVPRWAKDTIFTRVEVRFSMWDRLKVLFGYPLTVNVNSFTESEQGRVESHSVLAIPRLIPRKSKGAESDWNLKGDPAKVSRFQSFLNYFSKPDAKG